MVYDLVIFNGTVVNADAIIESPVYIGVADGKIACITTQKLEGKRYIDAEGGLITPGGIDSHSHIDQKPALPEDTFASATKSAICGGTTTVLSFATQYKDQDSVFPSVDEYQSRAKNNCYCDYGMHLIITKTPPKFLNEEMPRLVSEYGITSVKMYMTYDKLRITDGQILAMLTTGRKLGITTMIHAENKEMIDFLIEKFKEVGTTETYYHAMSHPSAAEDEASYRAITLSKLADHAFLIVHMSTKASLDHARAAQTENYPIYSETCPQYLFLTSDYLKSHVCCHCQHEEHNDEKPEVDDGYHIKIDTEDAYQGAKYICSPPLRNSTEDLNDVWKAIQNGTVTVFSSDHAPSLYHHPAGKHKGLLENGKQDFSIVPNGLPGLETRLPLLFCYGVETGRITPQRFVALASTNAAALYGMSKTKGSINVGLDADFCIWYPKGKMKPFQLSNSMLHHAIDYTPYEGMTFTNWPRYSILRGKVVWDRDSGDNLENSTPSGHFLKRGKSTLALHKSDLLPKYLY